MKRFLALLLAAVLLLVLPAAADELDLSGLSFDQLVALRDQLNLAIWNSKEWKEVTVPAGVWKIGEDIPAGHWQITIVDNASTNVIYTDRLDDFGKDVGYGWLGYIVSLNSYRKSDGSYYYPNDLRTFDLAMVSGMYLINSAPLIFSPYAGKPDLGFD